MARKTRRIGSEDGQVFAFVLVIMVVLIAMAGFALDVGKAYLVQRQLQAGVDAAALAAAQELPDAADVTLTANEYGPDSGRKNALTANDTSITSVTLRCVKSAPGCSSQLNTYNAVSVSASSTVKTVFAKIIGVDSLTVKARATACSPCAAKPLDIMLVLDRTGSMCQKSDGSSDAPACTDLKNAREGIEVFLGFMDTSLDRVGLAVFPPVRTTSEACSAPTSANNWAYDLTTSKYVIAPLETDFLTSTGTINPASRLVQMVRCVRAGGRTAYADAIDMAQAELKASGRPDVKDVIVFLSDGAANTGPAWHGNTSPYRTQPCRRGVISAAAATAEGTAVYTIGYDLNGDGTDYEQCHPWNWTGGATQMLENPPITSLQAMQQIASEEENFYNKPDPGKLNKIFTQIAADLSLPAARLIDDDSV